MRFVFVVFVLFVATALAGCSLLKSSKSISDSISSPSKSSSESSSPDDDSPEPEAPENYEDDVAQLAATYAKTGGDIGALRSAVSQLAVKRGITNWEADSRTCEAIGRGVGEGGMDDEKFTQFSKELFGEDITKQTELRQGYEAAGGGGS